MAIDKVNDGKSKKGKLSKSQKRGAAKVLATTALTQFAMRTLVRATKQASEQLSDDIAQILDTYKQKGGFSSREEARQYMDGFVKPKDIDLLIERARKLPEPYRTQELTRLSTPAYSYRMTRKKAIDEAQKIESRVLAGKYDKVLKSTGKEVMDESVSRLAYDSSMEAGIGISFDIPNMEAVDETLRGEGVYDKVKLFTDEEMKEVKRICTKGWLDGHSYDDIAKDVEALTGKESYKCVRLVRTTMAQASIDADYEEMKDLGFKEYEIHCTLDEKTCEICGRYDGKIVKVGSGGPMPTFHPNCRCYITTVMNAEGRMRAARNAEGKTIKVPASMTYNEYIMRYGSDAAKKRLGIETGKFDE